MRGKVIGFRSKSSEPTQSFKCFLTSYVLESNKDKKKQSIDKTTFILNGGSAVQGEGRTEATSSIGIDYRLWTMASPINVHYMT